MFNRNTFAKLLSTVLVVCILATSVPLGIFSNVYAEETLPFEIPEIVQEETISAYDLISRDISSESDLNSFVFNTSHGEKAELFYPYPVKYIDTEGLVRDKSLTFIETETNYLSESSDISVTVSKESEAGYTVVFDKYSVSVTALDSNAFERKLSEDREKILITTETAEYEYSLAYNGLKENIILEEYSGKNTWMFHIRTNGLTLDQKDNQIVLKDGNDVIMYFGSVVCRSYDEKNNMLGEITYETVKPDDEYILEISVPDAWLTDPETSYPVTIDPTILVNYASANTGIQDTILSENGTYSPYYDVLYVGKDSSGGKLRSVMSFSGLDLSGKNITSACVEIRDVMCETDATLIECYEYTGSIWTQSNPPAWSDASSYGNLQASHYVKWAGGNTSSDSQRYSFDITELAQKWSAGICSPARGILFKSSDEFEAGNINTHKSFASADYGTNSQKPSLVITYVEPKGFKSAYTADTRSLDGIVTAINYHNFGNLIAECGFDVTAKGFPLPVFYAYNSTTDTWNLSLAETLTEDSGRYLYTDGYGTECYFIYDSNGIYKNDAFSGTLTVGSTEAVLKTDDNVKRTFNINTGKIVSVEYDKSFYTFTYGSDGLSSVVKNNTDTLVSLSYTSGKLTSAFGYSFYYTEGKLSSIADKYGNRTYFTYTYNGNNILTNFDIRSGLTTNGLNYTFNTAGRVTRAVEYRGSTANNITDDVYTYGTGYTVTYSNLKNIDANDPHNLKKTYIFDRNFRTVNEITSVYGGEVISASDLRKDDIPAGSIVGIGANNLIEDSSFETNAWSGCTKTQDDTAVMGNYVASLSVVTSNQIALSQGTYCFSAYVKGENAKAKMSAYSIQNNAILSQTRTFACNDEWIRIYTSFTLESDQTVMLMINNSGSNSNLLIDCVQLEKSSTPTTYNILANSDFENGITGWTGGYSSYYPMFDTKSCAVTAGNSTYQTVFLGGTSSEKSYTVSGWLLPLTRLATAEVEIYFNGDPGNKIAIPFEGFSNTLEYLCAQFTVPEDITTVNTITIAIKNTSDAVTVCCDNLVLSFGDITRSGGTDNSSEGLLFTSNGDGTCVLSGIGTCTDTDIVIPERSPSGDTVKSVATGAFYANTDITSVTMPDSVETISENAFRGCTNLETVMLGDSVKTIYSAAFYGCTSLEDLTLGRSLTFMDSSAFGGCISLAGVRMPEGFETFESYAFASCTGLKFIMIPKSCTEIAEYCFINTNDDLRIYYEGSSSEWQSVVKGTSAIPVNTEILYDCESDGTNIYHYTYSGNNISAATVIIPEDETVIYEYQYDSNRNITYAADSKGNETAYTYDANCNLLSVSSNGRTTTYTYNNLGDLSSETDAKGNTTSYSYYTNGLLFTVTRGSSFIIYSYSNGLVSSVTVYHANSEVYGYTYNVYGNLTAVTVGGTTASTYTYTCGGRSGLRSKQESNGYIEYYSYDSSGNLLSQSGKKEITYDKAGNILRYEDLAEDTENVYVYDPSGLCVVYTFDANDGFVKLTQTDGRIIYSDGSLYTYLPEDISKNTTSDDLSRETEYSIKLIQNETETDILTVTRTFEDDSTYYSQNEVVTEGFSNGSTFTYAYDLNGNLVEVRENGVLKLSYTYDNKNELTRENNAYDNATYKWNYDHNGNILSKATYSYTTSATLGAPTDTVTYTYGNTQLTDLLTSYNGTTISYSGLNPTNWRNASSMTWQGRSLTGLSLQDGTTNITYTYNADGIRTGKTVGNVTTEYEIEGEKLIRQTTGTEVITFYYDGDELIGFNVNSNDYFYGKDSFGAIWYIYDTTGSIICTYTYDAWGRVLSLTGCNTSVGLLNPVRYKSYYFDAETGFYYLQSRYYDPLVGRFLNADDSDFLGVSGTVLGWNLFSYCENEPNSNDDCNGYSTISLNPDFKELIYKSYGGDQNWWNKYSPMPTFKFLFFFNRKKSDVGCGTVAAANIIAYLAKYCGLNKLTNRQIAKKEGFTELMDDVFDYVKPSAVGLWYLSTFTRGVEKYAQSRGVRLKGYWSSKFPSFNNAVDYIKDGLKRNCPVALNVHLNNKAVLKQNGKPIYSMATHWVVITEIDDYYKNGKRVVMLKVSSWGKEYTLDFRDVYYYSSYWALMYFIW